VREVPKKNFNVTILPAFNENLRQTKRERLEFRRKELVARYEAESKQEQASKDNEFWTGYSLYLRSPHWRELRMTVLRRDGYKCQNCFEPVTVNNAHVHHTSYVGYQRLGYSFAFECVTLCRKCHDTYHGGLEQAR